jgi:Flp pilus assembly protein CpaB
MLRLIYASAFVILAAVAGIFYYQETRQSQVVVAARDLPAGTMISESDLRVRSVAARSVPTEAVRDPDLALGYFVSLPVLSGQYVDRRSLSPRRDARVLTRALQVPDGAVLISLPVNPASAVGAALAPGDRVDVLAIPAASRLAADEQPPSQLIGRNLLVVSLRTEQGQAIDGNARDTTGVQKLGSVVLAVPAADEPRYASAMTGSSFFLALKAPS